jgi:septal ring factor EnvC (AmiA/AmiB activator)
MIRRDRSGRYLAATGSDTDALQTDVMRFMSILGLCLMAVFALVQSIPRQETEGIQTGPELEKLQHDIRLQQQRAQLLEAQLERLTAQTRSAQERTAGAQQALSSARQQLTLLTDQARQARSERDRLYAELAALKQQVAQARKELAGIEQAARTNSPSLRELQRQLGEEQRKLEAIDQRASALAMKPTAAEPVSENLPPPARPQARTGFTLRFASSEALERLVAAGAVSLYAMAGKQAWRLSLADGSQVFAPVAFPGWFHEMAPATVPVDYAQSLRRSVRGPPASPLVWGVQLPAATRQAIASLTRDAAGGDLVIGADGQVALGRE